MNSLFRGIFLSELSDLFDSDDDFEVDGAEDVDVIVRKHDDKFVDTSDSELDDDANDAEMDTSFSAPPYSPICPSHFNKESFLDNIDWDVIGDQNLILMLLMTLFSVSNPAGGFDCDSDRTQMDTSISTPAMANGHMVPYDYQFKKKEFS